MRVAAHLVRGGRSLGHEHTLPEEDTSVTHNSYGPHILKFSFHPLIFDFFQLEEYPLHKLHSVELSDGCSQTHSEETETPFVNRLLKMLTGIIFLHSHKIFSIFSFQTSNCLLAGHSWASITWFFRLLLNFSFLNSFCQPVLQWIPRAMAAFTS